MDVTLIGELTEGKNVGMEMQKNDKYEWIILAYHIESD